MSDEVQKKLQAQTGPVLWRDLRAHAVRGGLLVAKTELPLQEAAFAIATNATRIVEAWVASGLLYKPSLEQLKRWDGTLDKPFQSVVVQPFAVAQEDWSTDAS